MSNYHTTVRRREVASSPDQAKQIAEVVFEAEDSNVGTSSVLDALDALGLGRADAGKFIEFGEIESLGSLPFGLDNERPDWAKENVKVWLIEPAEI